MIVKSILDTDLYKFTTSYAYMKLFPHAMGTFEFFDRDNTEYTEEFVQQLRMAQDYLLACGVSFRNITVYHMFKAPRYTALRSVPTQGGFTSDIERDKAMTEHSDYDIAFIRKGKESSGTAQNILRRWTK